MKRRGLSDPYWEPARWIWLRLPGKTYALAPDAYEEAALLVAALPEEKRVPVPHAMLVLFAVSALVERGWCCFEFERTASGRRRSVVKLVPPAERPPPKASRTKRRVVRATSDEPSASA